MLNAAIVGLGRWGQNLVRNAQGSDKIRFTAGVLRHVESVKDFAAQHGLHLYDDYAKALADSKIDAVVLATPHSLHAEQIIAAAKAGKHVFTEKPFTLTTDSAVAAVRACAKSKVTLAVGYNWRFQPALQEIRRMRDDGRLGKLLHIEGNFCGPSAYFYGREHWRQKRNEGPAGGMAGRGVHVLDAMLYLAGPVASVQAQSYRLAQGFGLDDTTSMLIRFRNGVTGYLGTVIATPETWRMQIFGSRAWVEVGDIEHLTTWTMRVCYVDPKNPREKNSPQEIAFPNLSTERAELEHFAEAAAAGRPLAVAGGDEVHGVTVMEALMASIKSGEPAKVGGRTAPAAKRAVRKTATRKTAKRRSKAPARKRDRR
ncbi:MAG TPA: Gfo/Idh/MocA family oxidoreductase [Burkholderiales bacterium]|nr:Gfo/Idh/MocA family oxidoreductase [Burkholderiales bacterium]